VRAFEMCAGKVDENSKCTPHYYEARVVFGRHVCVSSRLQISSRPIPDPHTKHEPTKHGQDLPIAPSSGCSSDNASTSYSSTVTALTAAAAAAASCLAAAAAAAAALAASP
jgi:hypothetical protein